MDTNNSGLLMSENEDDGQLSKKDVSAHGPLFLNLVYFLLQLYLSQLLLLHKQLLKVSFRLYKLLLSIRKTVDAGTARRKARRSERRRRRSRLNNNNSSSSRQRRTVVRRRKTKIKRRTKGRILWWRSSMSQRNRRFTTPTSSFSRGFLRLSR